MSLYYELMAGGIAQGCVLPLHSRVAFYALHLFGQQAMLVPLLLMSAGTTVGVLLNWAIGWGLRWLIGRYTRWIQRPRWQRVQRWMQTYGIWLLLLAWAVPGHLIVLSMGVLAVRPARVLGVAAAVWTGYYLWWLMHTPNILHGAVQW